MDALGNPIHVHLSAGTLHDSIEAEAALGAVLLEGSVVLADKAYGSRDIRNLIKASGAQYCIPPKSNQIHPWYSYLMIPKLRNNGYIPFFITERKRSEAALIQVVQEAFIYPKDGEVGT